MIGTLEVTIFACLFLWIMEFFSRMTESQTRRSAANLNKIKPDAACTKQHALPRPLINDGFSTASGEDLNNQSFLRLKAKVDEKNLIVLENQRLANELSLVQSQLTDSHSKLRQFHNKLATTKSKLEEKESLITDMTEKNLRLANDDSRLRRKVEDRDRIIASSAIEKNLILLDKVRLENELSLVQSQLTDSSSKLQMFQNVHDELETTKCELEEKKHEITEIIGENLQLTNENSGLWRKIEAKDRVIAYKRANLEKLQNSLEEKKLHKVHEELASSQRALVSKNRTITKLQEQNRESRVEMEQLRTCLSEQQFDTSQLTVATSELESKTRIITELEAKNLSLAENDGRLRRKMEDDDRLLQSSQSALQQLQDELLEDVTSSQSISYGVT
jgi:chromosome segregation ATPase